jgi:hypothetical protein
MAVGKKNFKLKNKHEIMHFAAARAQLLIPN